MSFDMERSASLLGGCTIAAPSDIQTPTERASANHLDLVDGLTTWCLAASPAPMAEAALIFGLSTVGGIAARSYNIKSTGLAQYFGLAAKSGAGKGIIKKARNRLFSEVAKSVPAISEFRGMGYVASAPAQLKFLAGKKHPVAISDFDEFGHDLAEMSNPRNDIAKAKQKVHLEIWSLTGGSDCFDPMVYADKDKSVGGMRAVNHTFVGTTTRQKLNEVLKPSLASTGLLTRMHVIEFQGETAEYNVDWEWHFNNPPQALISGVADLAAEALRLADMGQTRRIEVAPDADAYFIDYAKRLRLRSNTLDDFDSDLLNRNLEKALRTAGTLAVGANVRSPLVTLQMAVWSTDFTDRHANHLLAKFKSGDVGEETNNENKQLAHMMRVIAELFQRFTNDGEATYGVDPKMLADCVFPHSYLQRRLFTLPAFKPFPKRAINDTVKLLRENDWIREVPPAQLALRYDGKKPKSYAISNVQAFAPYWPAGFSDSFRGELRW